MSANALPTAAPKLRFNNVSKSFVAGETLEWMGAEHLLASRARSDAVGLRIRAVVRAREELALAAGVDLNGHNPPAGLWAMDGAAYSPESMAPTIKISANPTSDRVLREQLDFDASAAFLGTAELGEVGSALFDTILSVASGTATRGEVLREGDEVVSRFGPAL